MPEDSIRRNTRALFALTCLITAFAARAADTAGELSTLLARLRRDHPAEAQKVGQLAESDRVSALRFLRERYGATPESPPAKQPPGKVPGKVPADAPSKAAAPGGKTAAFLPARHERFEKFDTLNVGEFAIDLCRRDDGAFGLGEIRRGATLLRRADFLVTWQAAGKFPRFTSRDGLNVRLQNPEATLTFVPEQRAIAGSAFAGFRIEFVTGAGPVIEIASWELGGATRGLSFFDGYRGWHAPPAWVNADTVPETNPKLVPSLLRGVGFQFEYGAAGALATFHTNPGGATINASCGEALEFVTTFNGAPRASRTVLVATGDSRINLWTRAHAIAHAGLRRALGLMEPPRELLVRWPPFNRANFTATAEQCAVATAADGFTGVLLDTIWENVEAHGGKKNLNTLDYAVSEAYGGEAGLRALVEGCHRHNLRVVAWTPTAHLVNSSPVWRAHPDWLMRDARGEPWLNPSGLSHGSLDTSFAGYWRDHVTSAVQRSGLDGLWMDTHLAYAGQLRPTDHEARLATLYAGFIAVGAKQVLVEGDASAFGACSLLVTEEWLGKLRPTDDADLLLGSSLVAASVDPQIHLRHFRRAVACGAGWIVDWDFLHSPKLTGGEVDAARREVRRAVADWRRVRDRMQHRFSHADGSGYTWTNDRDGARVVWLLRASQLPDGRRGEAGGVYVIEAAR